MNTKVLYTMITRPRWRPIYHFVIENKHEEIFDEKQAFLISRNHYFKLKRKISKVDKEVKRATTRMMDAYSGFLFGRRSGKSTLCPHTFGKPITVTLPKNRSINPYAVKSMWEIFKVQK